MERPRRDSATTLTRIDRRLLRVPSLLLVATLPDGSERAHALGMEEITVGSGDDCSIVLPDSAVSRLHCRFRLTERGVSVRDLESKNGTFVNGVEVQEAFVAAGSSVRAGNVTLWLRTIGAPVDVPLSPGASFGGALGGTVVMRALFARLTQAAQTSETILLHGESGTGKEVLARAIHDHSPRAQGPFVVFDAGAVSASLIETELFGHVRGAFTGAETEREGLCAQADGGTLFIDEIGELPLDLQPKLLRVLEARQFRRVGDTAARSVDVRVVAATHRNLRAAVQEGRFREDLFFRLAVIEAKVPPLRERKDDIELLVERLLAAEVPPRTLLQLPPGTLTMLTGHDWPGNVRELKNTVARLMVFPELGQAALEFQGLEGEARASFDGLLGKPWRDAREHVVERFEAIYLAAKLREHDGSVSRTATAMGISRQMVHRLMVRHGLRSRDGT